MTKMVITKEGMLAACDYIDFIINDISHLTDKEKLEEISKKFRVLANTLTSSKDL